MKYSQYPGRITRWCLRTSPEHVTKLEGKLEIDPNNPEESITVLYASSNVIIMSFLFSICFLLIRYQKNPHL